MKKLIVTRCDKNIQEMADITHPILERYAKFCDADFKIFDNDVKYHPHYKILQIYDLLKEYDRVLCIGTDTLILKSCPDIFKLVPIHMIASIYEDKGTRQEDRRNRILNIQKQRENIGWKEGYINSDVLLVSKMHRNIFNLDYNNLYQDLGFDDVEIGYQINKNKYEVYELPCEFNLMSMFLEPWSMKTKGDAYILHYAGQGYVPGLSKTEQIKTDSKILKRYGLLM